MRKTIIHSAQLSAHIQDQIFAIVAGQFEQRKNCYVVHHQAKIDQLGLLDLAQKVKIDINVLPNNFDPDSVKLMISDMDSTMISIECIDEIADYLNLKEQVSRITESAMRGEIDFQASLRQRVSLLAGLSSDVLGKVYQHKLKLNPGAADMVAGLRKKDIKTALVSGGFSFFTARLQQKLQIDFQLANQLEILDGCLTGNVLGAIVDSSRKRSYLDEISKQLHIKPTQSIAIGDGANDIEMLSHAGLGVAFRAKRKVQHEADVALNFSGLDAILDFIELV